MLTSDRTIRWIENLADQEASITAGEKTAIDLCSTKEEVLSIETVSFIRNLYLHFSALVRLFNAKVGAENLQIKVLRENDTSSDFSLKRNGFELKLRHPQTGTVQLQCVRRNHEGGTSVLFSGLVEAHFMHFHCVEWHFLGSKVSEEQVACHYITEFIQTSRDTGPQN